jgi:hypothetical protein
MAGSIMAGQTTNYLFDYPTSTDYVKDGATAIETLADDVDATLFTALGGAYPGLRLVKKQTIGSGVSSVTVTGAFSATYEAYKVILVGGVTSTNDAINFQLGPTSVSQYNSQYYQVLIYANLGGGAVTTVSVGNNSVLPYCAYSFGANGYNSSIELLSPFNTKYTEIQAIRGGIAAGANVGTAIGFHNSLNSFSGFQLIPASGTMTGGTIYVYGYGAS